MRDISYTYLYRLFSFWRLLMKPIILIGSICFTFSTLSGCVVTPMQPAYMQRTSGAYYETGYYPNGSYPSTYYPANSYSSAYYPYGYYPSSVYVSTGPGYYRTHRGHRRH
jgi:hypothetical protein